MINMINMAIQKFEDVVAWQKTQALAVDVYTVFSKNNDFGFKDQIFRSVVSISNNIAEGFDNLLLTPYSLLLC